MTGSQQLAGLVDQQTVDQPRPDEATVPPQLPGYEILEILGRGGMGIVYKARQIELRRLVALKMILHGDYADEHHKQRFRREAEAVARLRHANIVQIYEVGHHQGQPYFALEYCDGGTLRHQLREGPLPAMQAGQVVETLARAVEVAHQQRIVHRDLKPANVLLTADGTLKIADFGLARELGGEAAATQLDALTASGAVVGTPSYMAPEQARGAQAGPAADVYALGVILYELLTGRPPFQAANVLDTLQQVRDVEPVSVRRLQPRTPRDLETICLKCLHKEPGRRYGSAVALAEDLHRFGAGEPIQARPVGRWERGWMWVRRRPGVAALAVGLVVAVLLVLFGGSGAAIWYVRDRANREIAAAQRHAAEQTEQELESAAKQAQRDRQDGNFAEAAKLLERCLQLLSAKDPRYDELQSDLKQTHALLALPRKLPPALRGQNSNTEELLDLAELCRHKYSERYAEAAQLYQLAFNTDPKLAANLDRGLRAQAAQAAVLAATREGKQAKPLADKDKSQLRQQALAWLRADLADRTKLLDAAADLHIACHTTQQLLKWQHQYELASVRTDKDLAMLPAEEQKAWRQLWSEVADVLGRAWVAFTCTTMEGTVQKEADAEHEVQFAAGKTYVIDMDRSNYDNLWLEDAKGKILAKGQHLSEVNSRMIFTAPQDGTYRIIVGTPLHRSAYRLMVREFVGKQK